jgi:hypothetical protein
MNNNVAILEFFILVFVILRFLLAHIEETTDRVDPELVFKKI